MSDSGPEEPTNATGPSAHQPVMLAEVLAALAPADGEVYVDGTFGGGGYARPLLEAADCQVWGLDRDPDAVARGQGLQRGPLEHHR